MTSQKSVCEGGYVSRYFIYLFIVLTKFYICKYIESSLQSCNKYLIKQAYSGPYWENIGPRFFLYAGNSLRSVLLSLTSGRYSPSTVRLSRFVHKIHVWLHIELAVLSFAKIHDF